MTRPYFTNGVLSAFGSSGSLNNASDNPGVMSTNDVSVEGIANRTDIAIDNAMTDRTGTSYNYPSATNIQMPVLRDQHMPYRNASTSWNFVSSGDSGIVEPVSEQLAVENRFASGSYQTPSFVPQQSNWSSSNPFEAAKSGHSQFSLNHISTSYSAHDRGAPSGISDGMQFPSQTDGRSLATWTFARVPTGTTGTWPPNVSYTNVTHDAARSLPIRETDSNHGTRDGPTMLYHTSNGMMHPSSNGLSNSMVADYNRSTDTVRLPGETFATRETARPFQGPERPKNSSRHTSRKDKKRSQQEQDTRDKSSCRQCKSQKKLVSSLPF